MLQEKALIIGIDWLGPGNHLTCAALDELAELAGTAGAEVIARVTQRRAKPDPAYFVGYGKAQELAQEARAQEANLLIFDEELSPAQLRNLERTTGVKVVDRTGLILDIFAQRARTKEAKLQVELAQLQYLLPRLSGRGTELSRLGGGIGTRGPGESKLESDRRRIRQKMDGLKHELQEVQEQRRLMRRPRAKARVATIALVGYTNVGKSSLFNALTYAGALVENKLFATLDPTLRQLILPSRQEAVIADTVGFIHKLPHQLVAAFRATLEEVVQADLLLHVMDGSSVYLDEQTAAVQSVLTELGAGDHPFLAVVNKLDLIDGPGRLALRRLYPRTHHISALTGEGLDELKQGIDAFFSSRRRLCRLFLPFEAGGVLSRLHDAGVVQNEEYRENGVEVLVELDAIEAERLKDYQIPEPLQCPTDTGASPPSPCLNSNGRIQ